METKEFVLALMFVVAFHGFITAEDKIRGLISGVVAIISGTFLALAVHGVIG